MMRYSLLIPAVGLSVCLAPDTGYGLQDAPKASANDLLAQASFVTRIVPPDFYKWQSQSVVAVRFVHLGASFFIDIRTHRRTSAGFWGVEQVGPVPAPDLQLPGWLPEGATIVGYDRRERD